MLKVVDQLQSPEKPTMVKRLNFAPETLAVKTILPKVTLFICVIHPSFITFIFVVSIFYHYGLHAFLVIIYFKNFIFLFYCTLRAFHLFSINVAELATLVLF
jgi:hypothetical protein